AHSALHFHYFTYYQSLYWQITFAIRVCCEIWQSPTRGLPSLHTNCINSVIIRRKNTARVYCGLSLMKMAFCHWDSNSRSRRGNDNVETVAQTDAQSLKLAPEIRFRLHFK